MIILDISNRKKLLKKKTRKSSCFNFILLKSRQYKDGMLKRGILTAWKPSFLVFYYPSHSKTRFFFSYIHHLYFLFSWEKYFPINWNEFFSYGDFIMMSQKSYFDSSPQFHLILYCSKFWLNYSIYTLEQCYNLPILNLRKLDI